MRVTTPELAQVSDVLDKSPRFAVVDTDVIADVVFAVLAAVGLDATPDLSLVKNGVCKLSLDC